MKRGPRAERIAARQRAALSEQACEAYIRERMRPSLVAQARQATAGFRKEVGRTIAIDPPAESVRANRPRLLEQARAVVAGIFNHGRITR